MIKKDIHISKFHLNPENPRFEPAKNQQEAIELMLREAGSEVFNLGADIALRGLNPSKRVMVVEQNGHFLPLEGNRRVLALTLLNNPDATSNGKYSKKFKDLAKKIRKYLKRLIALYSQRKKTPTTG